MESNLIGSSYQLRIVQKNDALFIAELRSKPSIYRYLSSNRGITLEEQVLWIDQHLKIKEEYNFIIEDKSSLNKGGTISLYNYINNGFEFGRYVATNPIAAIEAEYLIIEFAFNYLNADFIWCRTAELNTKVWKQHQNFGFIDDGFEDLIGKDLRLKRQILWKDRFNAFDYSKVKRIVFKLSR